MNISRVLMPCLFLLAAAPAGADVYRWVDERGVVHYGDRIPPEAARRDRDILSKRGIALERLPAERTPEQRAAEARQRETEAERRAEREQHANRDRVLLSTYLSVAEIEMLRDRRLELLDAQARLTRQHLDNLHARQESLQGEAGRFDYPQGSAPDKPPLPVDLEAEMVDVTNSVKRYESLLSQRTAERAKLTEKFASDIGRFRELKGLD
ncbi:MAG: DUF4124 domain-containing protein [Gammaproteobacteria bacterium]|nr:DUF4124 domain-containing protein [Gammaproteobacteria bacterium]